ncbi:hypothetical protein CJ030_MR0G018442 [Morella rubra]|uniref:Putative plant transposon protein domain-containing protein n=1 Tax=Morella rubra TaxID=262757 RepID=A0A6A1UHA1_9ROSI|nr:hypothetical protein CJ030_MR0G018442 [Morella rubra]
MAPRRHASSSSQAAQQSLSVAQHQALIYRRPVVIERVVRLRDFNNLEYEVVTVDANVEELTIQVRGVFFTLSANIIAQFIGLLRPQVPAYPTIGPSFDMTSEEVWKEVTGENMTVPSTSISHRDLTAFFRMLHLIIVWDVAPKHHRSDLSWKCGFLLVMVARRTPIDLPALIVQQILRDARSTSERDGLPHGLLISRMLVAAGVPILPDEKIRSPIGPLCRSTFSRSAAHLHRGGANVNDDVDPDEVAMDEGPPPRSHPTRRGGRSTFEVGQSSSSQVERPPWMDTLLDEFTMRMDVRFKKIEEEIRELRKERDNA